MSHLSRYAKAVWVYAIHHTLEREGIDSKQIFSAHNFKLSSVNTVHDDVPRSLVNSLWQSAKEVSQDDAFCLKTLEFINEPFINALVSVTRACSNIRQALSVLQKFHTLISPELRLSVEVDQDVQIKVWNIENLNNWLPEDQDMTLAIIAKHGFAIATSEIKPLELRLSRQHPINHSSYQNLFCFCNLRYYHNLDHSVLTNDM